MRTKFNIPRTCGVAGCTSKYECKGYCSIHYMRMKRTGDPLGMKPGYVAPISHCSLPDCNRVHRAHGFCDMHDRRVRLWGDPYCASDPHRPLPREKPRQPTAADLLQDWNPIPVEYPQYLIDRFWSRVQIGQPDECWRWKLRLNSGGYGMAAIVSPSRPIPASRVAWILTYGEIPAGIFVCHRCDNPTCCNPNHLFIGTSADNTADKVQKGRGYSPPTALSSEQVQDVRNCYAAGGITQHRLARDLGVCYDTISRVLLRKKPYQHR